MGYNKGKESGYTVNSCMIALERIKFAGTKTCVTDAWKSICHPKT